MFLKHVDKFCLDLEAEKAEYEDLMNRPDIIIQDTKEKVIIGQGKEPFVYVLVYWAEEVYD